MGASLLRLRSDEQLVALFRAGHDEAFRVIHDRYRQRLFAYTRQMLPGSRQDAEDALQDIFVRAYAGLRATDRKLALRAWLYRIAHNRCVDELRRPAPPPPEVLELVQGPIHDPTEAAEQRESLRRLIADVRRLPEQQRSALLMRELGGMAYADMAAALAVSVPAVKSLLVRARVGLAAAAEARNTACSEIREELILAHDRGVRPSGMARRHMHDCAGCRQFRTEVRGVSRQFAALVPTLGPLGVLAKALGFGGGAGGAAGGSAAAAGGALGTSGGAASVGILATGAGHVATLLAAAVVTAGGAVELQHTITASPHHRPAHHVRKVTRPAPVSPPIAQQITVSVTTSSTATDSVQQVAAAVDASAPASQPAPDTATPAPPASTPKPQSDTTGGTPPTSYTSVAGGTSPTATAPTGATSPPTDIGSSNAVPASGAGTGTATTSATNSTNSATSYTTTTTVTPVDSSSPSNDPNSTTTDPQSVPPTSQPTASPASTTDSTSGTDRGTGADPWGPDA